MQTKSRALSLLLVMCMVLTQLPALTVFALGSGENCTHSHDEICGWDEDAQIGCNHEHDETCGGIPLGDSGNPATPTSAASIMAFAALDFGVWFQDVPSGAKQTDLILPDALAATVDSEAHTVIGVTWVCADYDGETGMTASEYEWTAVLPQGFILAEGVDLPSIFALVDGGGGVETKAAGDIIKMGMLATEVEVVPSAVFDTSIDKLAADGWAWSGAPAYTLTINSQYNSGNITFLGTTPVTLNVAGDVTSSINSVGYQPLYFQQSLTITGTGNLTLENTNSDSFARAIAGNSDLTITMSGSGAVAAKANAPITVSGTTTVTGGTLVTGKGGATLPTITSISPDTGPANGGTAVTLTGTGLTSATAVTVGGAAATNVNVSGDTQITFTTPAGSTGAVVVEVTTPQGTLTKANGFTYTATPGAITTADALKTELEAATPSTISVTADISMTDLGAITVGASHTLSVASGKTVTIDGSTGINVDTHTLTIQGAGEASSTLVCNRSSGFALYGFSGTLRLEDIAVEVTGGLGLQMGNADIGSGARLVLNVPDQANLTELVTVNSSLNVSGEIDIQDFSSIAISVQGSMTIKNGGTVKVGKGSQTNVGIEVRSSSELVVESGGTLTGGAGAGGIKLLHSGYSGAKVTGAVGKFIDRGQTLTENGQVTVAAATEPASATGLTAGVYTWNGSDAFEKYDIASIDVSAAGQTENFSVAKGDTLQLSAVVKDAGGTEVDAALRGVEWTIWGGPYASGTTISDAGLLTVAQDETQNTIYVMARSVKKPDVVNSNIFVTVTDGTAPTITGVTVNPTTANVQKGTTRQFSATVSGTGAFDDTVTWSVTGGAAGTSISNTGLLTVAANETTATLTVKAASTADTSKSGTATVTVTSTPVATYALTVTNGSGSDSYEAGATVTITANTPAADKRFKEWTVNSGGVALANPQAQSTTFTMPANAVEVTATYEPLPANTYSITVQTNGNGTANANVSSAAQGAAITLTATANSGYRFKEWQVISGGVNITGNGFTMPGENVVVKAIFEVIPAANYTITFNPNGGTVSETTRTITQGTAIGTLPTPTRSGSYRFDGWYTASSGGTQISAATVPAGNTTYYAHWTYTGGNTDDSDSGGSSSGGSGGGSGGGTTTSSPAENAPKDVTTAAAFGAAETAAQEAKASGASTATVRIKNPCNISLEALQAMADKAGMPVKFHADSMSANGKSVDVRITLDPAKATKGLNLSASTGNAAARARKSFFEKWFKNDVSVVSLGQQNGFGFPVEIAAKVDLTGMDTANLFFYSYDKATNSYRRIEKPAYWIDKNGYLHFTTELAGDVIISDGPLEKK